MSLGSLLPWVQYGAPVVGNLIGAGMQSRAATRAAEIADRGYQRAADIAVDNERRRREEYDRAEAAAQAQWTALEAMRAPYRAASYGLLQAYAAQHGLPLPEAPPQVQPMPPGWRPTTDTATAPTSSLSSTPAVTSTAQPSSTLALTPAIPAPTIDFGPAGDLGSLMRRRTSSTRR